MASNLVIKSFPLSGEIDLSQSSAGAFFWAAAAYITGGDVVLRHARLETAPLVFLPRFEKVGIPFEVSGEDVHIWFKEIEGEEFTFENSFKLFYLPLFLKIQASFSVSIQSMSEEEQRRLQSLTKEARRVGADVTVTRDNLLKLKPSKIRAGKFVFTADPEFNQALTLLALIASGKSSLLGAEKEDWVWSFMINE